MKYQNKLKNAARALAKETAERLGLTTDELLTLHAWASTEANGCPSFCAWCLVLESTPGSPPPFENDLAMKIDDPRSIDPRFSLVYDLITAFLIHKPSEFWTRNRIEHALQVCGVCGKSARPTPSGYVCEDGHGREEVRVIEDLQQMSEEMFGSPPPKQLVRFGERPTIKWNEGQSKAFHEIFDWYRSNSKPIYRLFGYAGTGKEQPESCVVQTVNGPKKLGTVRKGDLIYGRNGKLTRIIGVFPQGVKDVYEITFSDGTSTRCGIDHLWTIEDKHHRQRTVTTKDLLASSLQNSSGYKYRVPLCLPVQYPARDLPIDPYVMGVMLGDGSFRGATLTVTIGDDDASIIDCLRALVPEHDFVGRKAIGCTQYTIIERKPERKSGRPSLTRKRVYKNRFKSSAKNLGLLGLKSGDKFIPRDYLLSCEFDRLSLLRGLMDTDGTVRANNGCSFSTKSIRLAKGVQSLVQSLGGVALIGIYDRTHDDKGIEYAVNVKLMVNPFSTPRKADAWTPPKQNIPVRGIVSITKLGKEKQLCIKVSAKDELYLTDNFIVTHNTSMIQEIAWTIQNGERGIPKGEVLFAAYTGKAAAVMLSKGCAGAQTLHSLIYKVKIDPVTGQVKGFIRNKESPLRYAKLLICDEVSMVNAELAMDLLKFGVPILVVGDPGQLDPIEGEGFFTRGRPDTLLTKVERVALDNPLIWIATRIRKGLVLKPGRYGDSRIYAPHAEIRDKHIMKADQIICGRNKTRMAMNRRYRMLSGHYDQDTQFPVRGDRLMCLKNNKITGVLNGTQWHCSEPEIRPIMKLKDIKNPLRGFEPTNLDGLHFRVRSLDLFDSEGNPLIINTVCSAHHFDTNLPEPPWRDIAGTDSFTFGYAATAHKFQGSQTERTLVIDESVFFGVQEWKHRYTTATRASVSMDMFLAEAA
jgi:exodeoxyribonuclease-5